MNKKPLRFGIIGLGPVGQTLAVHLKDAGCEVAITDIDKTKLALIRNSGIELVDKIEKQAYFKHVYSSIQELFEHDFDVLITAVKDYNVENIIEQLKLCKKKDIYLLVAQNGLGIRKKYLAFFSEPKIFRMVVNFAGNLHAPNVTAVSFFNPPNFVASVDDSHPELAEQMSNLLSGVGLLTEKVSSFEVSNKIWEKTILNAALSPLCAISNLTMKEAMDHPDTLEIVEQIIYEAVAVAKAEEIKLPDNFVKLCIRYLKNAGNHMPSLAVDLINKRETEIDFMNGKIVEYGRKHYIKTPLNLTFTNLVRSITYRNRNFKDRG